MPESRGETLISAIWKYTAHHRVLCGRACRDGRAVDDDARKGIGQTWYHPIIVTDKYCKGFFEVEGLEVKYVHLGDGKEEYEKLLEECQPVALISIERCGRNVQNDYANMRGISIKDKTARTDILFEMARQEGIPTFGVGDGGNEIGMGNLKEVIMSKLALTPCDIEVDALIIATVSNWGAYALAAYMQKIKKDKSTSYI